MSDARRVVLIKPGDVLLIGNVGELDPFAIEAAHHAVGQLRSALSLAHVLLFDEDIDLAAVTPAATTTPAAATVVTLLDRSTIDRHREVITRWLRGNGVDVDQAADRWVSIELANGQRVIRYRQYRVSPDGHRLVDPDDATQGWTEERVVPLTVELDLPAD